MDSWKWELAMNGKTVAAYTGVLVAIQGLLFAVLQWLTQNELGSAATIHWIKATAAGVIIIGTALGIVVAALLKLRESMTTAVNAGLNLAASGDMVDVHGEPITTTRGATPPKPATNESMTKIVQDYGTGPGKP